MSWEEAKKIRDQIKGKCVFTNGCFDLLHLGHITYLKEAKALGDFLIVGLNSDASVQRLKGPERPLKDEKQRTAILAALVMVDMVVIFDQDTPLELIKDLKPDVLVKGGDYAIEDIVGAKLVLENGGTVESLSYLEGYSSSTLINKLKQ